MQEKSGLSQEDVAEKQADYLKMGNNEINMYDIFIKYSYSQLKELLKNAKTKDE